MSAAFSPARLVALRLLLVDEETPGRAARCNVLRELGCQVTTASSNTQALAMLEAAHYDVLITEYKAPGIQGAILLQEARTQYPEMQVILLSGIADALGLNECNTGAHSVIQKNALEVVNLTRSVKRLMSRRGMRKPPASVAAARQEVRRNQG